MKKEKSAIAIVFYKNNILITEELIYGVYKISLPKGHIEENETYVDCAIRECFEETNCQLSKSDVRCELDSYVIRFMNHEGIEIEKTIYPVVFKVLYQPILKIKEERIHRVEFIDINQFLEIASYDNVRDIVQKAKEVISI